MIGVHFIGFSQPAPTIHAFNCLAYALSALSCGLVVDPRKRACCRWRAATTRMRISAEVSCLPGGLVEPLMAAIT